MKENITPRDIAKTILAYNNGFVEYFQQHNYRAMFDLWKNIKEYLSQFDGVPAAPDKERIERSGTYLLDGSTKAYVRDIRNGRAEVEYDGYKRRWVELSRLSQLRAAEKLGEKEVEQPTTKPNFCKSLNKNWCQYPICSCEPLQADSEYTPQLAKGYTCKLCGVVVPDGYFHDCTLQAEQTSKPIFCKREVCTEPECDCNELLQAEPTDKEKVIDSIRLRILDEKKKYEKYEHMDWARIAAGKIYSSYIAPPTDEQLQQEAEKAFPIPKTQTFPEGNWYERECAKQRQIGYIAGRKYSKGGGVTV